MVPNHPRRRRSGGRPGALPVALAVGVLSLALAACGSRLDPDDVVQANGGTAPGVADGGVPGSGNDLTGGGDGTTGGSAGGAAGGGTGTSGGDGSTGGTAAGEDGGNGAPPVTGPKAEAGPPRGREPTPPPAG